MDAESTTRGLSVGIYADEPEGGATSVKGDTAVDKLAGGTGIYRPGEKAPEPSAAAKAMQARMAGVYAEPAPRAEGGRERSDVAADSEPAEVPDPVKAAQQAHVDSWQKQAQAWGDELRADTEIGGDRFSESMTLARGVLERFGDKALSDDIARYGLGNHPGLARMLTKIGRKLQPQSK